MFGFGKRKKETAKQEAIELGNQLVERINATLLNWRKNALETRRTMVDQMFAERLTELEPTDDLSYEMLAEIEALALTKNWVEHADEYADEFMQMLGDEDIECVRLVGVEKELEGHIWRNIQEVSDLLDEDVNRTVAEALHRRGETPTQ